MLGVSCSAATFRRAPVAFLAPSKTEYLALAPLPLVCVIVSSKGAKKEVHNVVCLLCMSEIEMVRRKVRVRLEGRWTFVAANAAQSINDDMLRPASAFAEVHDIIVGRGRE
jgi:hypothetical protein